MKLAFLTEAYDPFVNGIVTTIKMLRAELERRGHEVFVLAPAYRGHEDGDDHVIRLPSVQYSDTLYPFVRPFPGAARLFRRIGFDLIHTNHPFTTGRLGAIMSRRFGLPLVYTFHTLLTEYIHYLPFGGEVIKWALMEIVRHHAAHADRVLTSTGVVRNFLVGEGVTTPISVLPFPVSLMSLRSGSRERVRRQFGIPLNVPTLVYAGRLAKEKQLDFLLRAVARLKTTHDCRLLLLGGGPCEGELKAQASALGLGDRVIFAGVIPHPQMSDHYAAGDLFVFPSTSDTLGLVLIEAMSVGLPCVAVNRWGPSEVVTDGTGFLTDFEEEGFAAAVRRLLDDEPLRRQMSRAAVRRAQDFAPDAATDHLLAVYEQVLSDRRLLSSAA